MQALCFAFKLGQRDRLLPFAARAWELLGVLCGHPQMASHVLARKLAIKLRQRIGLTFLAPRLAPWRYVRTDNTSLDLTLAGGWGRGGATRSHAPGPGGVAGVGGCGGGPRMNAGAVVGLGGGVRLPAFMWQRIGVYTYPGCNGMQCMLFPCCKCPVYAP